VKGPTRKQVVLPTIDVRLCGQVFLLHRLQCCRPKARTCNGEPPHKHELILHRGVRHPRLRSMERSTGEKEHVSFLERESLPCCVKVIETGRIIGHLLR